MAPVGILYAERTGRGIFKTYVTLPRKKVQYSRRHTQLYHNVKWLCLLAPKRMELYPTPDQNTIPMAAEEQLAVHELAHVLQMESLNRGFSKGMSFL